MKHSIIVIGLAIVAASLSSCKKEYTCKCQRIYNDSTMSTAVNDGSYIFKDNAARAEDQCNKQEGTGSDLRGDYSRQCQIE